MYSEYIYYTYGGDTASYAEMMQLGWVPTTGRFEVTPEDDTNAPSEPYQEVYLDSSSLSTLHSAPAAGDEFTLPLMYQASDGEDTTGIGLQVFFDSNVLTAVDVTDLVSSTFTATTFDQGVVSDVYDEDSDASTDSLIEFAFGEMSPTFSPEGGLLANIKFQAANGDLASQLTPINIEVIQNDSAYNTFDKDLSVGTDPYEQPALYNTSTHQVLTPSDSAGGWNVTTQAAYNAYMGGSSHGSGSGSGSGSYSGSGSGSGSYSGSYSGSGSGSGSYSGSYSGSGSGSGSESSEEDSGVTYYNKVTQERRTLEEMVDNGWLELSEDRYGGKYDYPALYDRTGSHEVVDMSSGSEADDWVVSTIPAFETNSLTFDYDLEFYKSSDTTTEIFGILQGDFESSGSDTAWDEDTTTYDIQVYGTFDIGESSEDIFLETLASEITFAYGNDDLMVFDFADANVVVDNDTFQYGTAANIKDVDDGVIEFSGAVGDNISGGTSLKSEERTKLYTIEGVKVNSNTDIFDDTTRNFDETDYNSQSMVDGFEYIDFSEITAKVKTDGYETIFSTRSDDNANIKSLYEATNNSSVTVDADSELTLVEAYSNYVDWGTSLYTQRNIGSHDKTSLLRSGDTVNATATWSNVGSYKEYLNKVQVNSTEGSSELELVTTGLASELYGGNRTVEAFDVSQMKVDSDGNISGIDTTSVDTSGYGTYATDSFQLDLEVLVKAGAGTVLEDFDFYQLDGENGNATTSSKVSSNLVTFAGDLNYDGRVSLKDLAFLNAGVLAANEDADFSDVDANFDNKLDVEDLATLSQDFGGSLHRGVEFDTALAKADFDETIVASNILSGVDGSLNVSGIDRDYENRSFNAAHDIYSDLEDGSTAMGDLTGDPLYQEVKSVLLADSTTV